MVRGLGELSVCEEETIKDGNTRHSFVVACFVLMWEAVIWVYVRGGSRQGSWMYELNGSLALGGLVS